MSEPPRGDLSDTTFGDNASLSKRAYNTKYYATNRERLRQYAKEYRKTDSYKDRIIEYKRQYHKDNRAKIIERTRKYYEANRESKLAYGRKWRADNADKMREYRQKSKIRLRLETFDAYGGAICRCCGEKEVLFLTIDHVNNNGAEERRLHGSRGGYAFYAILRKLGYPPGYQVLCFNCNMAKGAFGICPHMTS